MTDETLKRYRESIDNIDAALVFLLAERTSMPESSPSAITAMVRISGSSSTHRMRIGEVIGYPYRTRWPKAGGSSARGWEASDAI